MVGDFVAAEGNVGAIGVVAIFGVDFADHLSERDFFSSVLGDVVIVDDGEGLGAFDSFAAIGTDADALAETA